MCEEDFGVRGLDELVDFRWALLEDQTPEVGDLGGYGSAFRVEGEGKEVFLCGCDIISLRLSLVF